MVGIRTAVELITTSVVGVGTTPVHQLPAAFQSVLTLPVHCPAFVEVDKTV
jgi:hypothetical protein